MKSPFRIILPVLAILLAGMPMSSAQVPVAYRQAAEKAEIGAELMYAIALVESGQSLRTARYRPWPWTLSVNGEPGYHATRAEAEAALTEALDRDVDQLGVGLFQIEYRYHSQRFESPQEMLDPYVNTNVAAEILREFLDSTQGDLWEAIGRWHSTTPDLASAYRMRVAKRLVELVGRVSHD